MPTVMNVNECGTAPLVSVITITRNRASLLPRAIKSVLGQTYKNIEYIILDGASTDDTEEVVKKYSDDKRLVYHRFDRNYPIVETLNIGFNQSHGDYITFLDDDDEYLPTKIEKQVNLFSTLDAQYGMVYCWMSYFDSATNKFIKLHNPKVRGMVADEVVERPLVSGTPTMMFRRSTFSSLGGWRDDMGIVSDWELAARCCQKWKVDYVPESLIKIYVNHGYLRMTCTTFNKDKYFATIKFHLLFLQEFSEIFDRYPIKKRYHYKNLIRIYIDLKEWKSAFTYYGKLWKIEPTMKNILFSFYLLARSLSYSLKIKKTVS